jgi:hypothetical protein
MTQSDIRAVAEAVFVVLAFFVMAPTVAAVIAYRASRGKPESFTREMYWTAFVAVGAVAVIVIRYAVRMETKDDLIWNLLRLMALLLGALLFGVSLGFGGGIFTKAIRCQRGRTNEWTRTDTHLSGFGVPRHLKLAALMPQEGSIIAADY